MAGKGRKFVFHGAFGSKRRAKAREEKGEFIFKETPRGSRKPRFYLVSKRG